MRVSYPWAALVLKMIFEDDEEVVTQPVFPVEVTVEKNSYNEADTAKAELNFKEFPFDPRMCKSIVMLVHMGVLASPNESPRIDENNLIFIGFVDVNTIDFDENDTRVILEARDYTALLLDTTYPEETVDLGKPLKEVIEGILAKEPPFAEIQVELRGIEETPVLGDFKSDRNRKQASVKEENYWDLIVDMTQQSGLICFIDKDKLVIQEAQSLADDSRIEPFVFGKNLTKLNISRDFRKPSRVNIEVRSYDDKNKKTLLARYPDPPLSKKVVVKDEAKEKFEYQRFVVKNINSDDQLKKIAKSVYWQLVRGEVKGGLETSETNSINSDNALLMTLRHGLGIYAAFDFGDGQLVQSMKSGERENYLKGLGYDQAIASKISALFDSDKLNGPYYVHKASHRFKNDSGYGLELDFINFVDVDTNE